MSDEIRDLLMAVLHREGHITLVRAPIEHYEAAYDAHTQTLRIDPEADPIPAMIDVLRDVVYGPAERRLVGLAGDGGDVTACGLVPAPATDEDQRRRPRLVSVPNPTV
ncbi:hypothetical protein [Amycolatopsis thermophila]|uniref:Uncharacterized protein n=1 Tax=Amycolatopsis thermophila TaxID=206084 RepID=A0ABU0ERI6_9PSEU|nr:hypothetical protein [Amycolatopsis thermophila]MDQ0377910.1 hypothetical protein [Amycolatopsis thermophila]